MGTDPHVLLNEEARSLLCAGAAAIPKVMHGWPVVEIGSGVGGSAALLRRTLDRAGNEAILFCVDACVMAPQWVRMRTKQRYTDQRVALEAALSRLPRVTLMPMLSDLAFEVWRSPFPIAFLFIDGGHEYKQVVRDLRWTKEVAPGGLVAIHDFGRQLRQWGGDGVTRAVVEFLAAGPDFRWLAGAGSMILLQRQP
jgi:hypothetical protein